MKKPTAYLPLYGNDFFEAVAGYSDAVGMGYLRSLWHYWNHTGCAGLTMKPIIGHGGSRSGD